MQISRGPSAATARQWLRARTQQPGTGPRTAELCRASLLDEPEFCWSRWHLTASCRLSLMTMPDGRHLKVSGPFSFSGGICRTSPLGIPERCRIRSRLHTYIHAVSWFSPRDPTAARQSTAPHSTTPYGAVETRRGLFSPAAGSQGSGSAGCPGIPEPRSHASMAGTGGRAAVAVLQRRATSSGSVSGDGLRHGAVHVVWLAEGRVSVALVVGDGRVPGRRDQEGPGDFQRVLRERGSRGPTSILRRGLRRPERTGLAEKFGRMHAMHTAHVRWWCPWCPRCPWSMQAGKQVGRQAGCSGRVEWPLGR